MRPRELSRFAEVRGKERFVSRGAQEPIHGVTGSLILIEDEHQGGVDGFQDREGAEISKHCALSKADIETLSPGAGNALPGPW